MNTINKKELLFELRDYFDIISYEDLQEILENAISYKIKKDVYKGVGNNADKIISVYRDLFIDFKNNITVTILPEKIISWSKNGGYHRNHDKPAVISKDRLEWYVNGKRHRNDRKPAVIWDNGTKEFWENGYFLKEVNL